MHPSAWIQAGQADCTYVINDYYSRYTSNINDFCRMSRYFVDLKNICLTTSYIILSMLQLQFALIPLDVFLFIMLWGSFVLVSFKFRVVDRPGVGPKYNVDIYWNYLYRGIMPSIFGSLYNICTIEEANLLLLHNFHQNSKLHLSLGRMTNVPISCTRPVT